MENIQYYYLIMSQKSLLQNQVIEEILRERANYYSTHKRNNDFWLLVSPNFIYSNNLNKKSGCNTIIRNYKICYK